MSVGSVVGGSVGGSGGSELESFLLLGKSARGNAAVKLIHQILESPNLHVFGEFLDLPGIVALSQDSNSDLHPEGFRHFKLLTLFAYGTLKDWNSSDFPPLTPPMKSKLQLLTISTLAAERTKILPYSLLLEECRLDSTRELEDLIIQGTNAGLLAGKLDDKKRHFEVDYAKGRDIKKEEIPEMIATLSDWVDSCDSILKSLENEAEKANAIKAAHINHKNAITQKMTETREQIKSHQIQLNDCQDQDPDSRMDVDRGGNPPGTTSAGGGPDRRDKKGAKSSKGIRGPGKGGPFWNK